MSILEANASISSFTQSEVRAAGKTHLNALVRVILSILGNTSHFQNL